MITTTHPSSSLLSIDNMSVARRNMNSWKATSAVQSMRMTSDENEEMEDDKTTVIGKGPATSLFSSSSSPWENPKSLVGSLLKKTTLRATRTLSTRPDDFQSAKNAAAPNYEDDVPNPTIQNVLDATIVRSSSILDGCATDDGLNNSKGESRKGKEDNAEIASETKPPQRQHRDKRTYLGNPSVTPTALAHSLWKSTILPHQDTVIDATCGNGKDCLALARMLFPDPFDDDDDGSASLSTGSTSKPQLIGIDIQERAIHNTKRSLLSSLPSEIYYNHVSLLEQSHEKLMDVPSDRSSVGLVCYNLGYLPGAPSFDQPDIPTNYKECQTQTETTLNSITDASLLLRVGGLLSIMTYPGSNLEESVVVEHFVEGLAMLTTRDEGGWRGYLDAIPNYYDGDGDGGSVRMLVTRAIERVVAKGEKKQTWRAFVHKPLGRPLSPVLATAMRIK